MRPLPRLLSLLIAALLVAQPAVACCTTAPDKQSAVSQAPHHAPRNAVAESRAHCADPAPSPPVQHLCECGDGCASMQAANSASVPDALMLSNSTHQPVALVIEPASLAPAGGLYQAQGLPPPATAPPARATLVSLKRLLLI